MYNNIGFKDAQSGKPAICNSQRETIGNGKTKDNKETTDQDEVGFAGFNGRFTRVIFVSGEKNSET